MAAGGGAVRRGGTLLVALVLVGTLLLTGCGIERAGLAASIGDDRLTVATVEARVRAYFDAYPAVAEGPSRSQIASITVQNFLRARVVDITAAREGISVTETEIDDFIEQFGGMDQLNQAIAGQGVPPDATLARAEVRSALLQGKLQDLAGEDADDFARAKALTDRLAVTTSQVDIDVNPRYGEWNGSTVDVINGSLSLTQAELVPTPTPSGPGAGG
jgi:peptidyl-prolyl cis-trans isomerase SurA